MGSGSNLVIQQAGDVSRMQEALQKNAELQQAAAAQENQRQEQLKRSQVQKTEHSATNNRVDKDGKHGGQKQPHDKEARREGGDKQVPKSGLGGLLDIVV